MGEDLVNPGVCSLLSNMHAFGGKHITSFKFLICCLKQEKLLGFSTSLLSLKETKPI